MWFIGAILGAILAAQMHSGLWIVGLLAGGALGWAMGSRARQLNEERFRAIDGRLTRIEVELGRLAGLRVSGSAGADAAVSRPARAASPTSGEQVSVAEAHGERVVAGERPERDVAVAATAALAGAERSAVARPARVPERAEEPAGESPGERAAGPVVDWLLRGNVMARVGVVILFFGVAFLLKYTYQHVHVPIELRVSGVAFGAVVLLVIGWRLRSRRTGYALALQAGGVGLLYLTIFAALRLFGLLPPGPAFVLLLAVVGLAAALAVLQDARSLAALGAAGGFLAPILASTGAGDHVALFAYYAVLNVGILAIAWFRSWRVLNLLGFAFTFGIATVWGVLRYRPEHFASTEPFLVLFFVIYVAIAVLFSQREPGTVERHIDTTLVFGVPLIAFALQVGLVRDFAYGSAWSALAVGAFYLLLARALWSRRGEGQRLVVESFLALGISFTTLAVPLAFDGRWTSAAWALEGAAIVWVGVRQQRLAARAFGVVLQLLAGFFYIDDLGRAAGPWPVLNSVWLGALLLAIAGLFSGWLLQIRRPGLVPAERWLAHALLAWGVVWWVGGGLHEIDRHVPHALRGNAALGLVSASCLAFGWLEQRLNWPAMRVPALALLPAMVVFAVLIPGQATHPFAHAGYIAWPAAFAAHLWLLWRRDGSPGAGHEWLHATGFWLFAALGAGELAWAIDRWVDGRAAWPLIGWALFPGALLGVLALRGERLGWPVATHLPSYLRSGGVPLAAFLAIWSVVGSFASDGDPWPLSYLPVLNPLDLAQAGALIVVATWYVAVRRLGLWPGDALPLPVAAALAGAAAFFWANSVLLRALHHWAGVPLHFAALAGSDLVQASLSLLWTLIALAAMVLATRRGWRALWLSGAGLLAVVVVKLLLVDLSNAGTLERIVSFVGVGLLMLLIGYLAPAPPVGKGDAR
ncbi:DUF2339 domain-containing protein [Accumulibacter sp.]|uniref:DUF2339 domain-containing protein n=1 Tax=Accumulibacter sp. TaxID=2053492 RepID=UPI0025E76DB0|nr:DUF2339 domain-containing protein [Accumulibacter sp.]MCM8594994.1 DUF2339 domain-containing protein [Accumulibacter sp.]MDS4049140.1 DUF2339 domain-containing protein [Accumulibacter sp.]